MDFPDDEPLRRGILGGSFDPVHLGHLSMAETVCGEMEFERIVFVPCFVSPFKTGTGTVANTEQRLEMLSIALEESELARAEISRFELDRPKPSYSWETAEHFHEVHPGIEWSWIVGSDQWDKIDRWAEPDRLRETLHFVVLTRDGDEVRAREGWKYTAVRFDHPASSTAIRKDFEGHVDWLTPGVRDYCRSEGLYEAGV
jgi:nicotinate-nucleotide adenylyltransferase